MLTTDDGSRTLRRKQDSVTFHSESGALTESRTVFLENSGIRQLWPFPATILEIGFGTGLNFWLTASAAIRENASLRYVAVEPNQLDGQVVNQLQFSQMDGCQPAYELFNNALPPNDGTAVDLESVELRIFDSLESFLPTNESVDAIYHDPFAPEVAPNLWSKEYFQALFEVLKPNRNLVTYCVKSKIQKTLKEAGFTIKKIPGPIGGKREVLIAAKPAH